MQFRTHVSSYFGLVSWFCPHPIVGCSLNDSNSMKFASDNIANSTEFDS